MAIGLHNVELVGISGSLRAGSMNTAILETLRERMEVSGRLTLIPLADIPPYNADIDGEEKSAPVRRLREAIASADGLVVASPEYNNGISCVDGPFGTRVSALDGEGADAVMCPAC